MKKRLFLCVLISILLLNITACSNTQQDTNSEVTPKTTETKITQKNSQTNSSSDKTAQTKSNITDQLKNATDSLELYSDDSRIVFKNEQTTLVFGYSENEITSYTLYIDYNDALTAKYALSTLLLQKDATIKNAYNSGKYLVVEYNESEFVDTSLEEIKQTYSLLEELKKDN